MSKKLMMNNYSESGLMPVTNGLICWLDGRDCKNGDTIWVDRSGNGNNGNISGNMNTEADKLENGYLKLEDSICLIPSLLFNSVKSICFYSNFEFVQKSGWQRLISESNGDNCICFWNTNAIKLNGVNSSPTIFDNNNVQRLYLEISDDRKRLILKKIDDVDLNFDANNRNISTSSVIQINGKGSGDKSKQSVASIMIYNRALTQEEIQQNYLYEQSIERGE